MPSSSVSKMTPAKRHTVSFNAIIMIETVSFSLFPCLDSFLWRMIFQAIGNSKKLDHEFKGLKEKLWNDPWILMDPFLSCRIPARKEMRMMDHLFWSYLSLFFLSELGFPFGIKHCLVHVMVISLETENGCPWPPCVSISLDTWRLARVSHHEYISNLSSS